MYWLNWVVIVGVELIIVSILMKCWFLDVFFWIWCVIFVVVFFFVNVLLVKVYVEVEFWFVSVKVVIIVIFIVFGGVVMFGLLDFNGKLVLMFYNFIENGGLFLNGVLVVFFMMIIVNYFF